MESYKENVARCKQCDHLLSLHGESGCGTWLLGVRAVPLYRCACVVSVSKKPLKFPDISPDKVNNYLIYQPQREESILKITSIGVGSQAQYNMINNSSNPDDLLKKLQTALILRKHLSDNEYTEEERQKIMQLSQELINLIKTTQARSTETDGIGGG